MNGGDLVAQVLQAQRARFLYTLCGGHISPILVGCERLGIRVIDTRHEATAVFAADATARLTGRPGVAAVTAGPGVTNTITALKNAQLAGSPVVLIGGAAPTALQGRGALQDIDQMALVRPHVKWAAQARHVRDLPSLLEHAFAAAQEGVPGPTFVECPLDVLYDETVVRQWYGIKAAGGSLAGRALQIYLRWHVNGIFAGARDARPGPCVEIAPIAPSADQVRRAAEALARARRPVLLLGSQAVSQPAQASALVAAVERIGAPVYLSGMARGLLGRDHNLQARHSRREALREADLVLLAGVPLDFRLDYGRHIPRRATYIAVNRSRHDLSKNRRPDVAIEADPGLSLRALAEAFPAAGSPVATTWSDWLTALQTRDAEREDQIASQMRQTTSGVNPLYLLGEVDRALGPNSIVVGDGGDFVGTAAYIVRPPGPLTWLDPGPFGTLGVGAGFALAAKLVHPDSDVWILYGDGSAGYGLAEFDTFARHGVGVIAVVGNDGAWSQIAREQVEMLGSPVGTVLSQTNYERSAEGLGAVGLRLADPELASEILAEARATAATGKPILVNALIGRTAFRQGSVSM